MKTIDSTKSSNDFIDYLNKNWEEGSASFEGGFEHPIRLDRAKRWNWGSLARARIEEGKIKIIAREYKKKKYDFNKLKDLLKNYEQKKKVKIILEIVDDY